MVEDNKISFRNHQYLHFLNLFSCRCNKQCIVETVRFNGVLGISSKDKVVLINIISEDDAPSRLFEQFM
jgi:hypothetical protein